jgi:ubiquinone/menaquinone biosynthesis C-methylase UbiE
MLAPLWIGLILVATVAAVGIGWRFASRRQSIPCPVWLGWMVELDNPFTSTNRAATIVDHLELRRGMRVLDVGCGPGRVTLPVARKIGPDGEVIAVDLQVGMLSRASERARAANLKNIRFVQRAVGVDPLDIHDVDRALLVTVLGEIPDREAALRAVFGALKPGGFLSVTEIVFDPHYQRRSTVTQLALATGFQVKAFFGNRLAYTLHLSKPGTRG